MYNTYILGKQFLNLTSAAKKKTFHSRMFARQDVSMQQGVGGGGFEENILNCLIFLLLETACVMVQRAILFG